MNLFFQYLRPTMLILAFLSLNACGGGGGDDNGVTNVPPPTGGSSSSSSSSGGGSTGGSDSNPDCCVFCDFFTNPACGDLCLPTGQSCTVPDDVGCACNSGSSSEPGPNPGTTGATGATGATGTTGATGGA